MNVNIKLNKNFTTQLNKLQQEYGEQFWKLQGLDDDKLSFTDFIDNFIDSDNVANASVDANSNIAQKDIVTLLSEMSKPHQKLLAFNKLYCEIQKLYGFKVANEAFEKMWNYALYMHDFNTATFIPYCFSGDTKFLTKQGIKRLDEMVDKDVEVLNKNHGWEKATVKKFGKQETIKLTLERYGNTYEVNVTPNHKWFVQNKNGRDIVDTEHLEIGMKIPFNTSNVWSRVNPSPFGVAHGFFIGDGDKGQHLRVNFCGDKSALIPYFTPANIIGTNKELTTIGVPKYFAQLPSLDENLNYLYGWLSGYFAADGCVDTKGRCTIASVKRENLEFVRDVLCVLGMPVNSIRYQDRISNLTQQPSRLYILTLSDEYLKEDFFIRPQHKERFIKNKDKKDRCWIVKSIEHTGVIEDVYCAVAEDTQSFTLDNNVLTHNCFAYDIKDIVEKGLFFIDGYNAKPAKHLDSFVQILMEAICYLSRRQSGAVGLPNLIPYMYYYWSRDVANGYYTESPETYKKQQIQALIYRLNQPWVRSDQASFTNVSVFDHPYFEAIFGASKFPDGKYMIDEEEEIIQFQKDFIDVVNSVREENVFTFPVLTASLLYQDEKFVDEDFAKWACEASRKWNIFNFFTDSSVNSLSNCCRLKSDVTDLYFNSIGGTALKVGSVKVSTLNIARLAYANKNKTKFLEALKELTELDLKILDAQRHIIMRNVEKGLLPNFNSGLIDFEHLYSTVGINGIYETIKTFGYIKTDEFGNTYYTDEAYELGRDIFEVIRNCIDDFVVDKNYKVNVEQIPKKSGAIIE